MILFPPSQSKYILLLVLPACDLQFNVCIGLWQCSRKHTLFVPGVRAKTSGILPRIFYVENSLSSPDPCGSFGSASSHKVKGHQFNSWSGHMAGLQVQSLVGHVWRQPTDVSLPHFLLPFSSH